MEMDFFFPILCKYMCDVFSPQKLIAHQRGNADYFDVLPGILILIDDLENFNGEREKI